MQLNCEDSGWQATWVQGTGSPSELEVEDRGIGEAEGT